MGRWREQLWTLVNLLSNYSWCVMMSIDFGKTTKKKKRMGTCMPLCRWGMQTVDQLIQQLLRWHRKSTAGVVCRFRINTVGVDLGCHNTPECWIRMKAFADKKAHRKKAFCLRENCSHSNFSKRSPLKIECCLLSEDLSLVDHVLADCITQVLLRRNPKEVKPLFLIDRLSSTKTLTRNANSSS